MFAQRVALSLILLAAPLLGTDTIRDVDFRNFTYRWETPGLGVPSAWKWLQGQPTSSSRLVNGRQDFSTGRIPGRYAGGYLMLRDVTYGDLNGDGLEEAAVDLIFSTGGTANWHYLYVFTMEGSVPRLLGRLQSGSRADGGLVGAAIQNQTLILDFTDSNRRVADCCSEGYIRVRYKLNAGRFVAVGTRELGDLEVGRR